MDFRKYKILAICAAIGALILTRVAIGHGPPNHPVLLETEAGVQEVTAELSKAAAGSGKAVSPTLQPAETPSPAPADGPAILEDRCGQCHVPEWLGQAQLTRQEWEQSLARMEAFGVTLGDHETQVLLEYLAGIERP